MPNPRSIESPFRRRRPVLRRRDRVGVCPACGGGLNYDERGDDDDMVWYYVSCTCGWYGAEYYELRFTHHGTADGSEVRPYDYE